MVRWFSRHSQRVSIVITAVLFTVLVVAGIFSTADGLPPKGMFTLISAGGLQGCGIAGGRLYCWGTNTVGQLGTGDTTSSITPRPADISGVLANKQITQLSLGYNHGCALANGNVYCWGAAGSGQLGTGNTTDSTSPVAVDTSGVLAGKTVTAIAAGAFHTCAIAAGKAYCWGLNSSGQLGTGGTSNSTSPVAVDTSGVLAGKTVTAIAAGNSNTCVVADGQAYCWGLNSTGQLGNNSTTDSSLPVAVDTSGVLSGKTVTALATGNATTCAIASGAAYCWGDGTNGKLGNKSTTSSNVPVAVDTTGVLAGKTVTAITAGASYNCAIASGKAYCWGYNSNGQLGNGSTSTSTSPAAIDTSGDLGGATVTVINTSNISTCMVADQKAYCWGKNSDGRLGIGTTTDVSLPTLVSADATVTGSDFRLFDNQDSADPGAPIAATDTSGTLSGSGAGFRLRMGVKTQADQTPHFTKIATGHIHSCGISNGKVYCWGDNTLGELGDGTTTSQSIPELLPNPPWGNVPVTDIHTNELNTYPYTCAIAGGKVYCWGSNQYGAIGAGVSGSTTAYFTTPQYVQGALAGRRATKLGLGDGHACAVADGQAFCWGIGGNGRLGTGNTTAALVPVAVVTSGVLAGKTVTDVALSSAGSCVIASGAAYCWGVDSTHGQLGDGGSTDQSSPVAVVTSGVLAGKTLTAIASGNQQSCVLASDSTVYCWGWGAGYTFGNNTTADSSVPVATTMTNLSGKTITMITGGLQYFCVVTTDGGEYCWGTNNLGSMGNGTGSTSNPIPATISAGDSAGQSIAYADTGNTVSCAVDVAGHAYCWGSNSNNQLGNTTVATTSHANAPLLVDTSGMAAVPGVTVAANEGVYSLQYTAKTAGTCSAQITGFVDVTASTPIAWSTNPSVANDTAISANANDPTPSGTTAYETYRDSGGIFTNPTAIPAGNTGLWDFSLKDSSGTFNTSYCLRIVYGDDGVLTSYSTYAEVETAPGELSVAIVDGNGNPLASPSFPMSLALIQTKCQTTTGTFGAAGKQLRVTNNLSVSGWSVSLAATNGASSLWTDGGTGATYDYNDPSGSPAGCNSGSDGDGVAGQLKIAPSAATATPKSGCSLSGISFGSDGGFDQGNVDAMTLLTGSSTADFDCYWDVTNIGVSQTIPASQSGGSYALDLTATAVAQ